jgi:hypothetical protein
MDRLGLKAGFVLLFVPLRAFFDDLNRFFDIEEFTHNAGSRLLERFVVLPIILCLLLEVFAEVFNALDVVVALVFREDGDDFIVHLSAIYKLHGPDYACFHEGASYKWFRDIHDLDVERVVVEIPGLGDRPVREWVGERRVSDAIGLEVDRSGN